jgi:hypothetical protein
MSSKKNNARRDFRRDSLLFVSQHWLPGINATVRHIFGRFVRVHGLSLPCTPVNVGGLHDDQKKPKRKHKAQVDFWHYLRGSGIELLDRHPQPLLRKICAGHGGCRRPTISIPQIPRLASETAVGPNIGPRAVAGLSSALMVHPDGGASSGS